MSTRSCVLEHLKGLGLLACPIEQTLLAFAPIEASPKLAMIGCSAECHIPVKVLTLDLDVRHPITALPLTHLA